MNIIKFMFIIFMFMETSVAKDVENIIVVGHGVENTYLSIESDCPENTICSGSWFKYKIMVKETISGNKISGEIVALRKQHSELVMDKNELSVFVIEKIASSDELAKKFGVKYYVKEYSRPQKIYCFDGKLSEIGIKTEDEISYHAVGMWKTNCVNGEELKQK